MKYLNIPVNANLYKVENGELIKFSTELILLGIANDQYKVELNGDSYHIITLVHYSSDIPELCLMKSSECSFHHDYKGIGDIFKMDNMYYEVVSITNTIKYSQVELLKSGDKTHFSKLNHNVIINDLTPDAELVERSDIILYTMHEKVSPLILENFETDSFRYNVYECYYDFHANHDVTIDINSAIHKNESLFNEYGLYELNLTTGVISESTISIKDFFLSNLLSKRITENAENPLETHDIRPHSMMEIICALDDISDCEYVVITPNTTIKNENIVPEVKTSYYSIFKAGCDSEVNTIIMTYFETNSLVLHKSTFQ